DVRRTSDGALVLMHDATLHRTTGDHRAVAEVSIADLAEVRVRNARWGASDYPPQPIPTLEEALRAIDGRAAIVVDFVVPEVAEACAALVDREGAAGWTWWTAHSPHVAAHLRDATPGSRSFLGWSADGGIAHGPAEAVDLAVRHGLAGLMA